MIEAFRKFFRLRSGGASAIEYALIASLIAIFLVTAAQTAGTKAGAIFGDIAAPLR